MTLPAPFSPLVAGGDGLQAYPSAPDALRRRMAEIYGVPEACVLPVRGVTHGLELLWRLALREGLGVTAPATAPYDRIAALYRAAPGDQIVVLPLGEDKKADLRLIDEGAVEFSDIPSRAGEAATTPGLIVARSLSLTYGLAGARIGALIGEPATLARLAEGLEPHALPEPSVRLALQALDPSRMMETEVRIAAVRAERSRIVAALDGGATAEHGPVFRLSRDGQEADAAALTRFGLAFERAGDALRLPVSASAPANDRLLAALGAASAARPARTGQAVRDTKETRIVCAVDLDSPGPIKIETGVGFFDHMLEQVAAHGGFSLRLSCQGDLHTDPHHTIEDSAIALGQALKQALGERRGIARYGFVLPMDEARASVSIDLSGRPYPVFEGAFDTPFIGDYRTDLTAHVVRSLAEHLGAAIHVSVTGDDDHHKTEAVYKALGRALRQAIRVEGDAVPSTKGVL